jgi:hypothetical protein
MNSAATSSLEEMAPPVAFAIRGPIAEADLPGLCARVCDLLAQTTGEVVTCDVTDVCPDAVTVDALAKLQLAETTLPNPAAKRFARPVRARRVHGPDRGARAVAAPAAASGASLGGHDDHDERDHTSGFSADACQKPVSRGHCF